MVDAEPDFADHPKIIDDCSNLLIEGLGKSDSTPVRSSAWALCLIA
jgi:hypothetical protein